MNLTTVLTQPIPDFTLARRIKPGYRQHALLTIGAHNDEPLVAIEDYGIAGQSYYSRPNNATNDPVPGVDPKIYVRKTIADKLAAINYELQKSDVVSKLCGGKVELYLDEGYRDPKLQEKLYSEVFPYIIGQQHPDWTKAQVLKRRDELIALPPQHGTPPPHATGAAVDVKLRYQHENLHYVPDYEVPMGHADDHAVNIGSPDYYEHSNRLSRQDKQIQQNRRVLYWIMKGALNGDDSGFVVNPTEWWHWSFGDQMWARLTQAPEAFYSAAKQR